MLDKSAGEPVDACGHGRVRREERGRTDGFERFVEGQGVLGDELVDAFEREEARVALVHVVDLGLRVTGQIAKRAYRTDTANTEEELLPEPVVATPAVEPVCDVPLRRRVALDVRVE